MAFTQNELLDEIRELVQGHVSNGRKICYAQSLGPITFRSEISNPTSRTRTATLRCTQPLDHDGPHGDGNANGWGGIVRFGDMLATLPDPDHINWQRCVQCGQDWPCDTSKIGEKFAELNEILDSEADVE